MMTLDELMDLVDGRARAYARGSAWKDEEDLQQEGILAALGAMETWDPDKGPLENYLRRSVTYALRAFVRRGLSPVSCRSVGMLPRLEGLRAVGLRSDEGGAIPDPGPSPEAAVHQKRWREAVIFRLRRIGEESCRAELGVEAIAEGPRERARQLGVSVRRCYKAAELARDLGRGDVELLRLWRER